MSRCETDAHHSIGRAKRRRAMRRRKDIVERTCQPERFTVLPAEPEPSASDGVREPRVSYRAGDEGAEHGRKEAGYGDDDAGHGDK